MRQPCAYPRRSDLILYDHYQVLLKLHPRLDRDVIRVGTITGAAHVVSHCVSFQQSATSHALPQLEDAFSSERAIWAGEIKKLIGNWYAFQPPLTVDGVSDKAMRGLKNDSCIRLLAPWSMDVDDPACVRAATSASWG
jgi:hypothetical protein